MTTVSEAWNDTMLRNSARLMVRRHMADLINQIASEDTLVRCFLAYQIEYPDKPYAMLGPEVRVSAIRTAEERARQANERRRPTYKTLE